MLVGKRGKTIIAKARASAEATADRARASHKQVAAADVDQGWRRPVWRPPIDAGGEGLAVELLHKPLSKKEPNVEAKIAAGELDCVINVRDSHAVDDSITDGYMIRRKAVDFSVTLLTDIKLATLIISAMARRRAPTIKAWDQYGL